MLRAILSNRLSSNNEAKENRNLHKTPKKTLNKTFGNKSGKKINKLQAHNSDINALNIISDDNKESLKQNNLKTPLKISQQRAPLSNIKKANVKEKSLKNLNNQLKKTHSLIKKSSTTPSSSIKINKINNENENIDLHGAGLKRQNSLSLSSPTLSKNNLKKTHSFEYNSHEIHQKENIFLTHMKKNSTKDKNLNNDDIEYMPPSLSHLEEEVEPKYKINYDNLLNIQPATIIDSDVFKSVNDEIDIKLDPEINKLKTKNFEFVDEFILDLDTTKKNKEEKNVKEKLEISTENNAKDKNIEKKEEKSKVLQEKLSQDFNLSFEEASDDEEIKLPDFLVTEDKDSLYFDEIQL